ncbi:MAG: flagellar basal body L-ring protein FlgH [Gammaproteobacteria bacterium]
MKRRLLNLALLPAILLGSGCATIEKPVKSYHPRVPKAEAVPEPSNGSIYQAGYEVRLFEDMKAKRVGDIITIVLDENTSASKSAKTSTGRDTSIDIDPPTLLGSIPTFNVPGLLPLASNRGNTPEVSLKSSNSFEGSGDSEQSNRLRGSITVTVEEVYSNGNMLVQGEKWITLNQGDEYLQISGIVRAQDVTPQNTVLSTLVADARIAYSGKGSLANANRGGWLARFFNSSYWPF